MTPSAIVLPGGAPAPTATVISGGRPVDEATIASGTARLFRRLNEAGMLIDVEPGTNTRHHLLGFMVWFSQTTAAGAGTATELEVQLSRRTPSGGTFAILETIYKQAFAMPASNFVPFCSGWIPYYHYGSRTPGGASPGGDPISVTYTLNGTVGAATFDVGTVINVIET